MDIDSQGPKEDITPRQPEAPKLVKGITYMIAGMTFDFNPSLWAPSYHKKKTARGKDYYPEFYQGTPQNISVVKIFEQPHLRCKTASEAEQIAKTLHAAAVVEYNRVIAQLIT